MQTTTGIEAQCPSQLCRLLWLATGSEQEALEVLASLPDPGTAVAVGALEVLVSCLESTERRAGEERKSIDGRTAAGDRNIDRKLWLYLLSRYVVRLSPAELQFLWGEQLENLQEQLPKHALRIANLSRYLERQKAL